MGRDVVLENKETQTTPTTQSLFEQKMKSLDTHPDVLNASGAKLELLMHRIICETTRNVQRGKLMRSQMKPHLWIIQPTMEPSGFLSFRRVGANRSSYAYGNTTRRESAGKYFGLFARHDPTSEREAGANKVLKQLRGEESEFQVCTCQCSGRDPSVAVSYVAPLCVEGKMCLIGCGFNLYDEAGDNPLGEFQIVLSVLDRFKSEVYLSRDAMVYAQANLREYMLVDYPRKFMWHHNSLITVKNTFLNIQSSSSPSSYNPRDNNKTLVWHHDEVVDEAPQAFEESRANVALFERICKDIGLMFDTPGDITSEFAHQEKHHFERVGSKVVEWNLEHVNPYIDKWRASWREDLSFPSSPNSNGNFSFNAAATSSSPNRPIELAGLTSSSSSSSKERRGLVHEQGDEEEEEEEQQQDEEAWLLDTSFCVLRTQSAPTVGSSGESDYLPLYLQNYGDGYTTSAIPPQQQQQKAVYGVPIPPTIPSERFMRNPDAAGTSAQKPTGESKRGKRNGKAGRGEASRDGNNKTGDEEGHKKKAKRARSNPLRRSSKSERASSKDSGSLTPADAESASALGRSTAAEPSAVHKLQVGDRVELHSFPHATWLWGLTGMVKHVLVEQKRRNRVKRVTIVYDNPEYQEKAKYLKTIPISNARLIKKCGGSEDGGTGGT